VLILPVPGPISARPHVRFIGVHQRHAAPFAGGLVKIRDPGVHSYDIVRHLGCKQHVGAVELRFEFVASELPKRHEIF